MGWLTSLVYSYHTLLSPRTILFLLEMVFETAITSARYTNVITLSHSHVSLASFHHSPTIAVHIANLLVEMSLKQQSYLRVTQTLITLSHSHVSLASFFHHSPTIAVHIANLPVEMSGRFALQA